MHFVEYFRCHVQTLTRLPHTVRRVTKWGKATWIRLWTERCQQKAFREIDVCTFVRTHTHTLERTWPPQPVQPPLLSSIRHGIHFINFSIQLNHVECNLIELNICPVEFIVLSAHNISIEFSKWSIVMATNNDGGKREKQNMLLLSTLFFGFCCRCDRCCANE